MDIEQALISEHSKRQTMNIVKFVGDDKTRFKELLHLFLNGEYRITQRAAWSLSLVSEQHPALIRPHLSKLIKKLNEPGLHPAIPRNILRIFQEIEIPEKLQGRLVDLCFKFITDAAQPVAVKAFSITVAARICGNYPELKKELLMVLEELNRYPQQPALRVRLRDAFKQLQSA
jgi:hypothetical protein